MEERKRGRPKGTGTGRTKVPAHISIDRALLEWAHQQPGGLSATVRNCLEKMQQREEQGQ